MSHSTEAAIKVIQFRAESEFPIARREIARCKCSNITQKWGSGELPSAWLCGHTRMVECKHCGAMLEPFDYLYAICMEGESLFQRLREYKEANRSLKAERSVLEEELKQLRQERNRLKKEPAR